MITTNLNSTLAGLNSNTLKQSTHKNSIIKQMNESFKILKNQREELLKDTPILENSIRDQIASSKINQKELNSLKQWMDENKACMQWLNIDPNMIEVEKLFRTSKTIDEFKEKYLEFQAKQEQYTQNITNDRTKTKPFKPIQAESKNKETYKDDNIRNELIKKLLENKFDLAKELEILFNVKIDNYNTNNNNSSNSNDNNSNSNHLGKLSSKTKTKHRSVNIKV